MKRRSIPKIMFWTYLVALLYVLLFAERNVDGLNGYNTELLAEIRRYIQYREVLGIKLVIQNLLGNVVGFIPFGILLPEVNQRYQQLWRTVWTIAAFSLTIEIFQLLTGVGCFDVDDVLLNAIGGMLGYLFRRGILGLGKKYGKE